MRALLACASLGAALAACAAPPPPGEGGIPYLVTAARTIGPEALYVEAEAARDHYIKHADEGWALANRRTVQWKQAERERDEARAEVEKAHESVDGLSKVPRGRPLWTRVETALLDVGDDAANYSRQAAKARLSARAWKALASVYRASMSLCSGPCHLFVRERRPARRTHGR
ncbi:MAG: hypothetical protein BWZ09_02653 [Alphaproteobacteria bacterium ADurb.BinA305]|nr:MAG: hypothetical protein BWZ09_02653 [Alphaproteobacteria bacterium ADurb.BinA305]